MARDTNDTPLPLIFLFFFCFFAFVFVRMAIAKTREGPRLISGYLVNTKKPTCLILYF